MSVTVPPDASVAIRRFDAIDSTSRHLRREFVAGRLPMGPVVAVADVQTGGVGRFSRQWTSPPGGLWFSLAYPLDGRNPQAFAHGLGLRVGVACLRGLRDAVSDVCGPDAAGTLALKWPNDVLVDGRKVLGVLVELASSRDGRSVCLVGVGVNANFGAGELPPELAGVATTLRTAFNRPFDLDRLRTTLTGALLGVLSVDGLDASTLEQARAGLFGVGKPTRVSMVDGSRTTAVLVGLDDSGVAVFQGPDGRRFAADPGSVVMIEPRP